MIELFFLRWFYPHLADAAEGKGRSRSWGGLGVGLWIAGELTGVVLAAVGGAGQGAIYGLGLGLAGIGAIIAYAVVSALESPREEAPAPLEF